MADIQLENIRQRTESLKVVRENWSNDLALALDRTQTNLERLRNKISELESRLDSLSPFSEGPRVVVKSFFLTDDLTVPVPDEPNGTVLIYTFEQDAAGLHTVTWPPEFIGMWADAVALIAESTSGFMFLKTAEGLKPIVTGITGVEPLP